MKSADELESTKAWKRGMALFPFVISSRRAVEDELTDAQNKWASAVERLRRAEHDVQQAEGQLSIAASRYLEVQHAHQEALTTNEQPQQEASA